MTTVVIGLLGSKLDRGGPDRWDRWRPSVDLCRQEDLLVDRFELLCDPKVEAVARTVAADLAQVSPETEVRIHPLDMRDAWDFESVYGVLHDFARGYPFDPEREQYLIHVTTGTHVQQICLFLLTESRHLPGQLLQMAPPKRGGAQPGRHTIIDLDLSRYDRLASRFRQEQREGLSFLKSGIETRSPTFNALIERIERVAVATRSPLLLTGPTGAGKSQLARRIYELKKARDQVPGPFVEANCATLRGDAAMSALFGHVRGAFTGAQRDRAGLLRSADRGVLFLDEVGELGLDEQAMLLRAIEEKVFLPVGADQEVRSEFQLIAGTNRDLPRAVRDGRFREDLLARINLWTFHLPGLRDRREDVEPNLDYELEKCSRQSGTRVTFSKEARTLFLRFATGADAAWPGNFRDFNAAIVRMSTLAAGGRIDTEVVRDEIERLRTQWEASTAPAADDTLLTALLGREAVERLDAFDHVQLAAVVARCARAASLSDAGRALFAASRGRRASLNDADRLRKYLARFDLTWAAIKRAAGA